jgi:hypothetical protein
MDRLLNAPTATTAPRPWSERLARTSHHDFTKRAPQRGAFFIIYQLLINCLQKIYTRLKL